METLNETAESLTKLVTSYNQTHKYITVNSTPEWSKQNAKLTHLCNVPSRQIDIMTYFKPLPDEYEDTEHTDYSANHAASAYIAKIKRIEAMAGFGGTETPGLYYRVIKSYAFCDAAFFLKPQLDFESSQTTPTFIASSVDTLKIPPVCPDISSPEFKAKIKENGQTFSIEFFGYILAEKQGIYAIKCTNNPSVLYSARIWLGDTALVEYANDDVNAWEGWTNISNSSLSVYRLFNNGERIPIRILYTQQSQPIDAYDFGISLEINSIFNGTITTTPTFVVRTDTNGDPYEPTQLTISKFKMPNGNPNTNSHRIQLRHIPINATNNWKNNTIAREISVKTYYNIIEYNVFNSNNTNTDLKVKLYPNGNISVGGQMYPAQKVGTVCSLDSTCGCVMQLTNNGDIIIYYTSTGSTGNIENTETASTFKRNTLINKSKDFKMIESWMLDKGEWPILGSPQHLSKGHYLSQSNTKTQFYSNAANGSPAIFDINTQIYSRNGKYMLTIRNAKPVVITNSIVNIIPHNSIFSVININNIAGGTYLVESNKTNFIPDQYYIAPTNEIFGQNNTYEKYIPHTTTAQKLGFPPKVMEGSTAYKQSNVSAEQCKKDCDDLKTGCSHYYTITQQTQPGCIINIDGNNPEYLPNTTSSQITDSSLYIKNRTIMSECPYTTDNLKTPLSTDRYFWPMTIKPFETPTPANEGACGVSAIQQKREQLGLLNTPIAESFAGYDESSCTTGSSASIAACKAKIANNVNAIGQYTLSHGLSVLNQNATDIRNLTNEIIGEQTTKTGEYTRYPTTTANTVLANKRSKYLNPRDTVLTTPDVRLNDVKSDVAQQNTQFIMGVAASIAVGLFATTIAMR